jgi:hypothetical protein
MADDPKSKILSTEFNQEVFDEEKTVADKDNVGRVLKPKEYVVIFTPEFAPTGHIGVKRDLPSNTEHQAKDPPIDVWGSDISVEDLDHGYIIQTKIEDEASEIGVEGGRISRLTLIEGERDPTNVRAHFDNGEWKELPKTFLEKQIVMEMKERYNGITLNGDEIAPEPDPDHDLDI